MNLRNDYPDLYQFFAGYFPDADLMSVTDEQVVAQFVSDGLKGGEGRMHLTKVKEEISDLITKISDYEDDISLRANRYFENTAECIAWLEMVQKNLVF